MYMSRLKGAKSSSCSPVPTKRGRVGAVLAADHFNSEPLCPNIELLNRSSAKRVGSRQHYALPISLQIMREFRCRCCFAGSVHADNQDHGWLAVRSMG